MSTYQIAQEQTTGIWQDAPASLNGHVLAHLAQDVPMWLPVYLKLQKFLDTTSIFALALTFRSLDQWSSSSDAMISNAARRCTIKQ